MSDPKLPRVRSTSHQASRQRDDWRAAERIEIFKSIGAIIFMAIVLVLGGWLIIRGLSR